MSLLPFTLNAETGRLLLTVPAEGVEYLYVDRLSHALGDYRLERGNLSRPNIVRFERRGGKLLLLAINTAWRTASEEVAQQEAVRQSFPTSVLWSFDILQQSEAGFEIDATGFFLRDSFNIAASLSGAGEGPYTLDPARCAIAAEGTAGFPRNIQVEAILTFANPRAAQLPFWFANGRTEGLAALAPDPRSITLRVRGHFIALPEPGFKPRRFDPRSSFFSSVVFHDFGVSLEEPRDVHYAIRHRLEKADPTAAISAPVKPITYYVDRGVPEPVRTALVEGARWWNQAFEAAGFRDAIIVEPLPEGADPIDIRYNIITYAARPTRGFSNGKMIWDPRTGEIIQGVVTLTALRERHLRMIGEALLSPYEDATPNPDVQAMMLARMRQLSAHEVAHTLGLDHNHVASTFGGEMSVCDYPAPMLTLDGNGRVNLSRAYGERIGDWDMVSIQWGYTQFPPGTTAEEEAAGLDAILDAAHARGLYTIAQQDAVPETGVHPKAHNWDTGEDAADELIRLLDIRAAALARFGETAIKPGRPMALLADVLVPLYFLHRYQTEAAVKCVGGLDFRYALRGDRQLVTAMIPGADQRRALAAVLATLEPRSLTLPEAILRLLPPRPPEYDRSRDSFAGHTGLTFDAVATAEAAATHTLALLLSPARAARLVEYNARDASLPGLHDVLQATLAATFHAPAETGLAQAVKLRIEHVTLRHVLALAASEKASAAVTAMAQDAIETLRRGLAEAIPAADIPTRAHRAAMLQSIAAFAANPAAFRAPGTLAPPPGMPI